ncbi:VG15 protein [Nocardiopsis alba]
MAALLRDLAGLWPIIRLGQFGRTVPQWQAAATATVNRYAMAATVLASDYYETERRYAEIPGLFVPDLVEVPEEKAAASFRWATSDLWIPEQRDPPPIEQRLATAKTKADGAAEKLVADATRETIVGAVEADLEARGWVRQAALGACSFCKLMAIRGPVYSDADAAGGDANSRFQGDGDFKFHDHCNCHAAVIFRGQTWAMPPHVREWKRVYDESTKDVTEGGAALRNAFRRALADA